jgi:hypothetical protein
LVRTQHSKYTAKAGCPRRREPVDDEIFGVVERETRCHGPGRSSGPCYTSAVVLSRHRSSHWRAHSWAHAVRPATGDQKKPPHLPLPLIHRKTRDTSSPDLRLSFAVRTQRAAGPLPGRTLFPPFADAGRGGCHFLLFSCIHIPRAWVEWHNRLCSDPERHTHTNVHKHILRTYILPRRAHTY